MIYGSEGRSPYEDDEIYLEMNPPSPLLEEICIEPDDSSDEIGSEIKNKQLSEVLDFYDCYDLLPYANHIIWLSAVKESLGEIPFNLDYEDICCLVILAEEISKKSAADAQKTREKTNDISSHLSANIKHR